MATETRPVLFLDFIFSNRSEGTSPRLFKYPRTLVADAAGSLSSSSDIEKQRDRLRVSLSTSAANCWRSWWHSVQVQRQSVLTFGLDDMLHNQHNIVTLTVLYADDYNWAVLTSSSIILMVCLRCVSCHFSSNADTRMYIRVLKTRKPYQSSGRQVNRLWSSRDVENCNYCNP